MLGYDVPKEGEAKTVLAWEVNKPIMRLAPSQMGRAGIGHTSLPHLLLILFRLISFRALLGIYVLLTNRKAKL